jgi:hypothetical protein
MVAASAAGGSWASAEGAGVALLDDPGTEEVIRTTANDGQGRLGHT